MTHFYDVVAARDVVGHLSWEDIVLDGDAIKERLGRRFCGITITRSVRGRAMDRHPAGGRA